MLTREEFLFLGEDREKILAQMPCLLGIASRIRARCSENHSQIDPWLSFETAESSAPFPPNSRHRTVHLHDGLPSSGSLSVGLVQGSFDPFHMGHLLMGVDAVADGACDFTIFMPNADRSSGGDSAKPDKTIHEWRMRTAFAGGVDDFFPAARLSPFGGGGDTLFSFGCLFDRNRNLIERLAHFSVVAIFGSDVVLRPKFIEWTNMTYGKLRERSGGKAEFRFRVVERPGYSGNSEISDILSRLDYPSIIVPEISCASSSSIRQDPFSAIWLYPRSVPLLEAFLLYGRPAH